MSEHDDKELICPDGKDWESVQKALVILEESEMIAYGNSWACDLVRGLLFRMHEMICHGR